MSFSSVWRRTPTPQMPARRNVAAPGAAPPIAPLAASSAAPAGQERLASSAAPHVLALDQGTTSSRAILFDARGRVVCSAAQEFKQHFPQPGWVEHDALDIWASQLAVAQEILQKSHIVQHPRHLFATNNLAKKDSKGQPFDSEEANCIAPGSVHIAAIGITNQRETTVLWDRKTGQPLAKAIVWQDRRTVGRCDELRAQGKAAIVQAKTGLLLDAYFSATKLEWLLAHIPGARAKAERGELAFGTVDSWLVYKLTGGRVHATDASNASRTLLFNIHTLEWDRQLLALFGIPASLLPTVVSSSAILAQSDASVLGIAAPIAGIAGDQQAATFGQACFAPGTAKTTYGTGCFMLMNTGTRAVVSKNKLLTTVGWRGPGADELGSVPHLQPQSTAYCLEGSVFMGGATVQWLRDGLGIIGSAEEVEALAASVTDTGDVMLVPAFAGLGAPHWDGHARGTILGLTRGTTKAHIARAALEAIALQVADVFEAMARDSGIKLTELRVDGGASNNNLLMQMQADLLGVPVLRPVVTETTALGAAYLAGLATGVWEGGAEIAAQWQVAKRFEPSMGGAERAEKMARWRDAVERAKGWAKD